MNFLMKNKQMKDKKQTQDECRVEMQDKRKVDTQSGRSMVEMLCVLAIIGVLSVIGVVGIQYAMQIYKENETVNAFSVATAGARTAELMQSYIYTCEDFPCVVKPKSVISTKYDMREDDFTTAIGSPVQVRIEDEKGYTVRIRGISREVCESIKSGDWGETCAGIDESGTPSYPPASGCGLLKNLDCSKFKHAESGLIRRSNLQEEISKTGKTPVFKDAEKYSELVLYYGEAFVVNEPDEPDDPQTYYETSLTTTTAKPTTTTKTTTRATTKTTTTSTHAPRLTTTQTPTPTTTTSTHTPIPTTPRLTTTHTPTPTTTTSTQTPTPTPTTTTTTSTQTPIPTTPRATTTTVTPTTTTTTTRTTTTSTQTPTPTTTTTTSTQTPTPTTTTTTSTHTPTPTTTTTTTIRKTLARIMTTAAVEVTTEEIVDPTCPPEMPEVCVWARNGYESSETPKSITGIPYKTTTKLPPISGSVHYETPTTDLCSEDYPGRLRGPMCGNAKNPSCWNWDVRCCTNAEAGAQNHPTWYNGVCCNGDTGNAVGGYYDGDGNGRGTCCKGVNNLEGKMAQRCCGWAGGFFHKYNGTRHCCAPNEKGKDSWDTKKHTCPELTNETYCKRIMEETNNFSGNASQAQLNNCCVELGLGDIFDGMKCVNYCDYVLKHPGEYEGNDLNECCAVKGLGDIFDFGDKKCVEYCDYVLKYPEEHEQNDLNECCQVKGLGNVFYDGKCTTITITTTPGGTTTSTPPIETTTPIEEACYYGINQRTGESDEYCCTKVPHLHWVGGVSDGVCCDEDGYNVANDQAEEVCCENAADGDWNDELKRCCSDGGTWLGNTCCSGTWVGNTCCYDYHSSESNEAVPVCCEANSGTWIDDKKICCKGNINVDTGEPDSSCTNTTTTPGETTTSTPPVETTTPIDDECDGIRSKSGVSDEYCCTKANHKWIDGICCVGSLDGYTMLANETCCSINNGKWNDEWKLCCEGSPWDKVGWVGDTCCIGHKNNLGQAVQKCCESDLEGGTWHEDTKACCHGLLNADNMQVDTGKCITRTSTPGGIITQTPTPTTLTTTSTQTPTPTTLTTTRTQTPTPTTLTTTRTQTPTSTSTRTSTSTTQTPTSTSTQTPTSTSTLTSTSTTQTPTSTSTRTSTSTTPTPTTTTWTTTTTTPTTTSVTTPIQTTPEQTTPTSTTTQTPTPTSTSTTSTQTPTPTSTSTTSTQTPTPTSTSTRTSTTTSLSTTTTTKILSPGNFSECNVNSTVSKTGCKWTGWLDSGQPETKKEGGDVESLEGVCDPGWNVKAVNARAAMFPSLALSELGQGNLICNLRQGFICRNQDQVAGRRPYPMPYCLNYEINVLCCPPDASSMTPVILTTTTQDGTIPQTPTPTPTTTTGTGTETTKPAPTGTQPRPTTSTSKATSTSTSKTTSTKKTTPTPTTLSGTFSSRPVQAPVRPQQSQSTQSPETTSTTNDAAKGAEGALNYLCPDSPQPPMISGSNRCKWSDWVNSHKTTTGGFWSTGEGDKESLDGICDFYRKELENENQANVGVSVSAIRARSTSLQNYNIKDLSQTVTCNTTDGLICKNSEQKPGGRPLPYPYCLDYEIQALCCMSTTPVRLANPLLIRSTSALKSMPPAYSTKR